jgi:beta-RFAP synthase
VSGDGGRDTVFVETAGRLHFGVLDLGGSLGRWFGGLGAPAPAPTLVLSAEASERLEVDGDDAERATGFASQFLSHYRLRRGARLRIHRALPRHAGLGSGTQLALSVARALAEIYDLPRDVRGLARAVGRARRSAVGTWTFADGGLVVEGGRAADADQCGPLISRLPIPAAWHCVLAVPDVEEPGLSGAAEEAIFAALPTPDERDTERVAHLVLMALLPALADGDLPSFGRALTQIQDITGCWFAAAQGGAYARGPSADLVRRMREWGACGVGQSSWGPTVYGIVPGEAEGRALAADVGALLDGRGRVYAGPFPSHGARVWKGGG